MIDEMKPTSRTILNRIKEVFSYRIEAEVWDIFVNSVMGKEHKQQQIHVSQGFK
jgi:hypothetical protein